MSKNLVGKNVRRYAFMYPRIDPKGVHKVRAQGTVGEDEVVWLEGFSGCVHIDAIETIEDETPLFSASLFKMKDEITGITSYGIHKSESVEPNGVTFSDMLFLKDTSYEKAREGLIEYAKWKLPFLDTELYV